MKDKEKYFCIFVIIVILLTIFLSCRKKNILDDQNFLEDLDDDEFEYQELDINTLDCEENIEEYIYVHIAGAVKQPGLIKVKSGTRLAEAIDICKGTEEDACLNSVNLALKLLDEQKVYIPKKGEKIEDFNASNSITRDSDKLININEASKEELVKLPGIGNKTAEKIINYRQNSRFKDIHDLMDVPGIGEGKFNDLESLITTK